MASQTVVVGAGLAGLSAAIHLAAAGRDVVVVEAEAVPGGRCGTATVGGYRFDTGPSVLTMPEVVRATVGAAGEELEDWLELAPLDPTYRLTFHDGSRLDVLPGAERMAAEVERLAGPEEAARYLAFRDHLGRMLDAEWSQFIDRNLDGPADLLRPLALARLARLGGFRRLHSLVATHLTDWRLRRAHTFQALYTGLSPFDALGIYAVVAQMDTVGGAWFPRRGGMHALALALAGVAAWAGTRAAGDRPPAAPTTASAAGAGPVSPVVARVRLGDQARQVALGAGGMWVLGDRWLHRIDPAGNRVLARVPVGTAAAPAAGLALSPDAAWVPAERSGLLWRVDRAGGRAERRARVDATLLGPLGVAVLGDRVWLSCCALRHGPRPAGLLLGVDARRGRVVARLPVPDGPLALLAHGRAGSGPPTPAPTGPGASTPRPPASTWPCRPRWPGTWGPARPACSWSPG
jgi:hypothetical protein